MTYRAERDLVLCTLLDELVEQASRSRGRIEDFAAIAATQQSVFDVVQARVDRAAVRPWWRRWF